MESPLAPYGIRTRNRICTVLDYFFELARISSLVCIQLDHGRMRLEVVGRVRKESVPKLEQNREECVVTVGSQGTVPKLAATVSSVAALSMQTVTLQGQS